MKLILLRLAIYAMRLSFIGIVAQLIFFNMLIASSIDAQPYSSIREVKIDINLKDATIYQVFKELESKTSFSFTYNENTIKSKHTHFTFSGQGKTIEELLIEVSKIAKLRFKQVNNNINVLPLKEENSDSVIEILVQGITITGRVISGEDQTGLPGVNVVVKGTSIGTVTDIEGKYSLEVPDGGAILNFSSVGYIHEEVEIGNRTVIDITLMPDITALEEIVVVGYGTQSKKRVTGAIQTVDADDVKEIPVAQAAQALQGRLSGVQINQTTGTPGEALKIRVRGSASLNAGNDPLYVVDGFAIDGDLTDINPQEIQSITVLKDASSAALYGSRAANGVILVETKSGKGAGTNINFSAYYGVQNVPERGRLDLMNGTEFAQFKQESYLDRGVAFEDIPPQYQNPEQYGEGTNWYDIMFNPAPIQDYTLTITHGTEKLNTSVVAGYFNQEGVMFNSGYERYSLRINSQYRFNDHVRLGFNAAPTYSEKFSPPTTGPFFGGTNLLYNAILAWPIVEYKNLDGSLPLSAWIPNIPGEFVFPMANYYRSAQEIKTRDKNFRVLSNAFLEVEPIKNLVLKSSINFQLFTGRSKVWNPSTASLRFASAPPVTATLDLGSSWDMTWLNENTATYTLEINDHVFDFLAGFTAQKFYSNIQTISAENFPDDRISDLDAAVTINYDGTDETTNEWSLLSYLGRVNYSYLGKYNLSAVIRRDGSSRFGSDNLWGLFPSVSASWVISDEGFFPENGILSNAKLRASWGITGNNNIGNYTQYALVNLGQNAIIGNSIAPGARVANLNNTELGWETTNQTNFGIDIGLFNNRIDLAYDYYMKKTTDLLYDFSIPQSSGFATFTGNSGEIKFWGHEITLLTKNLINEFKWDTQFNITFSDNEVLSLAENVDAIYNGGFGSGHITRVGDRVGLFWGLISDGVYVDQNDYDNSPKADRSAVGTIKFRDVNGDGVVLNTDTGGDRTIIGDPTPTFMFGMTNNFLYKNFDLSITVAGSYGNDINNSFMQGAGNLDGVFNVLKDVKYRWRSPENPGDGMYGTTQYNTGPERDWFNSRFIEDGSYLSIKNVTLGYNFNFINNSKVIKSLRLYTSIQQLYTFTNYSGNNPEVSNSTNVLTLGDDMTGYPVPRTWTFGVNVGF